MWLRKTELFFCHDRPYKLTVTFSDRWDFPFATRAELISWRVFSLASIAAAFVLCLIGGLIDAVTLPNSKDLLPSSMVGLTRPAALWTMFVTFIVGFNFYIVARLGIIGLVFSSLRALPTGSYTTVGWITSIPHF